jgi:hypothetical protein
MALVSNPKENSAKVRKGVLLLAKLAEAADNRDPIRVVAANNLFQALPDDIRATSRQRFSAVDAPVSAVTPLSPKDPAPPAARPEVGRHEPLGPKPTIQGKGAPTGAAVSGGRATDDAAALVVPGVSSGDVADVAQQFGVNPNHLKAFVQTPEFEKMVAEELARRAGQEA